LALVKQEIHHAYCMDNTLTLFLNRLQIFASKL
jgi:hypothetical protein